MATRLMFREVEMVIDEGLGYPKAYAKLCRDPHLNPYSHGPPFTFIPYALPHQEVSRARELDQLFPVIDLEAKPSPRPKIYMNILWKQLNHLGNAGFDPAKFRVDPYGNVVYYHADSASPLAWEIDHWFPYTRGGRTVPSNLRILQWQVCKKKHNKLEFLVPWWDLQLGISVNQFLSIFASSNSDFRNRAFSWLFFDGENEELNSSQTVDSHAFPQHFTEMKKKVGLAPAAIVSARRETLDASSTLRSIDLNQRLRASSPITAGRKSLVDANENNSIQSFKPKNSKENDDPNKEINPYLTIAMARDSLRQREEMQTEIEKLDDELEELKQKNEAERVALQDLELVLIKRRRRAEKSRRLADAQSSYKALLEKMIRDAMHQSVIYKEQVRLNQAATSALMARLEAQKAMCDDSERELHRKFKNRDEIESQIRPYWDEQARKRTRMNDDALFEKRDDKNLLLLPETEQGKPLHKELRVFLEEEHKANGTVKPLYEEQEEEEQNSILAKSDGECSKALVVTKDEIPIEDRVQKLEIEEVKKWLKTPAGSPTQSPDREEDEEGRKQRGKGNVEKWLQILLEGSASLSMELPPQNAKEDEKAKTEEIIEKLNIKNPQEDIKILKFPESEEETDQKQTEVQTIQATKDGKRTEEAIEFRSSKMLPEESYVNKVGTPGRGIGSSESFEGKDRKDRSGKEKGLARSESARAFWPIPYSPSMLSSKMLPEESHVNKVGTPGRGIGSSESFEGKDRKDRSGKEKGLARSESARAFWPIPYSPSMMLGMKKGTDCIGKKPIVIGSDEDGDEYNNHVAGSNFIKSSIKTIKKAVKK